MLGPTMSFKPYDENFATRLTDISLAFFGCQSAFRELAEETEWRPAEGSPAAQDRERLQAREPPYPTETATLIIFLNYFYMSAASEHLGALGALYEKRQVLIPPPALVRCVLEHCARILWVLQEGNQPVEDRIARAYLEVLFSAVERKKTTGRMLGKDSKAYLADTNALKRLQEQAAFVFGEPIKDAHGRDTLRGQQMPGLEDCVAWMVGFLKTAPSTADHRGIYDYVSNISHPTLYPHIEMWQPAESDGQQSLVSQITLGDHERRAALAIVPFCETLSYLMSYNGWPRRIHAALMEVLDKVLPSAITPAEEPKP
jgi:hypothetical protein